MWNRFFNWIKNKLTPSKPSETVKEPPVVITPCTPRPVDDSKIYTFPKGAVGVDISHHNADVDLDILVKSVEFIYMKATEGASFVSSAYLSRAKRLKELGANWGAYHYYKFKGNPIKEAQHFLNYIDSESTLPPVLDIEAIQNPQASSAHLEDVLDFLEYIEEKTGIRPIVYGGYYFLRDQMKTENMPALAKYQLWLPWYRNDFAGVKCPAPWSEIKIWQKAEENIKIDGVNGNVDVNEVVS